MILISAACSTEKEEEEWYYAIYVRDTCEMTPDTIYSEYYCVSKETYNRAVELFEQDDCAEINFKSLDGETIQASSPEHRRQYMRFLVNKDHFWRWCLLIMGFWKSAALSPKRLESISSPGHLNSLTRERKTLRVSFGPKGEF